MSLRDEIRAAAAAKASEVSQAQQDRDRILRGEQARLKAVHENAIRHLLSDDVILMLIKRAIEYHGGTSAEWVIEDGAAHLSVVNDEGYNAPNMRRLNVSYRAGDLQEVTPEGAKAAFEGEHDRRQELSHQGINVKMFHDGSDNAMLIIDFSRAV